MTGDHNTPRCQGWIHYARAMIMFNKPDMSSGGQYGRSGSSGHQPVTWLPATSFGGDGGGCLVVGIAADVVGTIGVLLLVD